MTTDVVTANTELALGTLYALGSAYRGDWSDMDGRTIRAQLESAASLIHRATKGENVRPDIAAFYEDCGLCGRCGSWTEHCYCEVPA